MTTEDDFFVCVNTIYDGIICVFHSWLNNCTLNQDISCLSAGDKKIGIQVSTKCDKVVSTPCKTKQKSKKKVHN